MRLSLIIFVIACQNSSSEAVQAGRTLSDVVARVASGYGDKNPQVRLRAFYKAVDESLANGIDPKKPGNSGFPALVEAVTRDVPEFVPRLVGARVSLEVPSKLEGYGKENIQQSFTKWIIGKGKMRPPEDGYMVAAASSALGEELQHRHIPMGRYLNANKELRGSVAAYLEPWDSFGLGVARNLLYRHGVPSAFLQRLEPDRCDHSGPTALVVPYLLLAKSKRELHAHAALAKSLHWSWRDAEWSCERVPGGFQDVGSGHFDRNELHRSLAYICAYSHPIRIRLLWRNHLNSHSNRVYAAGCQDLMAILTVPGKERAVYRAQAIGWKKVGTWLWQSGYSPFGAGGSDFDENGKLKVRLQLFGKIRENNLRLKRKTRFTSAISPS